MRVLEEVLANAKFAPEEYLRQLCSYLAREEGAKANGEVNGATDKEDKKDDSVAAAERKLEVVRLALARNLSRALVGGDGPF